MTDNLLAYINRIEAQTDKYGIFDVLHEYGEHHGFVYTTIGRLVNPHLQGFGYDELGVSNFPEKFQKAYISGNYILHDPVVARALISDDPFLWSSLKTKTTSWGREILEEGESHDLGSGLTIPIRFEDFPPGIVSYAGPTDNLSKRDINSIQLLCVHGYSRLIDTVKQKDVPKKPKLTARQKEILTYVASGKTDWEIGRIIDIAEYSVKDHMTNIRRKLGAANRAHCVMIAIRDGHITL